MACGLPSSRGSSATTSATPRIACNAVTTGAIDLPGSNSSIWRVSRANRASASLNRVDAILQHELLCRMGKSYRRQPFRKEVVGAVSWWVATEGGYQQGGRPKAAMSFLTATQRTRTRAGLPVYQAG